MLHIKMDEGRIGLQLRDDHVLHNADVARDRPTGGTEWARTLLCIRLSWIDALI
jgi:hypothetical protein